MPFPVDKKHIDDTQKELGVIFPDSFVSKMLTENGGEMATEDDDWQLFPFFDQSDSKRISRTCNHIALETKQAREWNNFPKTGVAIAKNGFGDNLILLPEDNNPKVLLDTLYIWYHETGEIVAIANSIIDLMNLQK